MLDHDQYESLVTEAGSYELYWVQAIDPDKLLQADWKEPETKAIKVQFLNVTEPHVYRARGGEPLFVIPHVGIAPLTYDFLQQLWPEAGEPWGFIVRENRYDALDETYFYFRDGQDVDDGRRPIPKFEQSRMRTH